MAVLLAVSSALVVGTGDFVGGLAGRKGRVMAVVVFGQATGVLATVAFAPFFGGTLDGPTLFWGALAGIGGGLGIAAMYAGFARSSIAVVSPIAAVGTAAWPVVWDVLNGEIPGWVASLGVGLGLIAIWVVSGGDSEGAHDVRAGVRYGVLAGLGLGTLFILLSFSSDEAGIWALLPARSTGAVVTAAVAVASAVPLVPGRDAIRPAIGAGVLTVLGNGFFILATTRGSLAVVSVVTAMFPAATVLWARVILGELLSVRRKAGLALALLAVGLVAAG